MTRAVALTIEGWSDVKLDGLRSTRKAAEAGSARLPAALLRRETNAKKHVTAATQSTQ